MLSPEELSNGRFPHRAGSKAMKRANMVIKYTVLFDDACGLSLEAAAAATDAAEGG